MNWSDMSYDEQRAFMGLSDVRGYVARYRLRRLTVGLREMFEVLAASVVPLRRFAEAMATEHSAPPPTPAFYSRGDVIHVTVPTPARKPPMWAIDASRARRPRESRDPRSRLGK